MPDSPNPAPHAVDRPRCGATTRAGGSCGQRAGARTDHEGQGRCFLHGGASPILHGRYSKITRPRIAGILKALEDDPNPLDLLPDLRLLRALLIDFVDRYEEFSEALLAWHSSFGKGDGPQKPRKILDITAAKGLIAEVGAMVERIEKQTDNLAQNPEFQRVYWEMSKHVTANVTDAAVLRRIREGWQSIPRQGVKDGSEE